MDVETEAEAIELLRGIRDALRDLVDLHLGPPERVRELRDRAAAGRKPGEV